MHIMLTHIHVRNVHVSKVSTEECSKLKVWRPDKLRKDWSQHKNTCMSQNCIRLCVQKSKSNLNVESRPGVTM